MELQQLPLDLLPENAFITLVGHRGSGKTYLAKWIFNSINTRFDDVFVMTKTGASGVWDDIVTDTKTKIFRKDFPQALRIIIECQEKVREEHGKPKMPKLCIVLDDILHHIPRNDEALGDLATTGRWLNCTVILLSQYYKAFVPDVRDNTDLLITFANLARGCAEDIFDETCYSVGLARDQFRDLYRQYAQGYRALAILRTSKAPDIDQRLFWVQAAQQPRQDVVRPTPSRRKRRGKSREECIIL